MSVFQKGKSALTAALQFIINMELAEEDTATLSERDDDDRCTSTRLKSLREIAAPCHSFHVNHVIQEEVGLYIR